MDAANPLGVRLGLIYGVAYLAIALCFDWWRGIDDQMPHRAAMSGTLFAVILITARHAYAAGFKAAVTTAAATGGGSSGK